MIGRVGSSSNSYMGVNYAQMNDMRLQMALSNNKKVNSVQKLPPVSVNKTSENAQFLRDFQKTETDTMSKSNTLRDGYYKQNSYSTSDSRDNKKTASAIEDMVSSYNKSLDFVQKNAGKGVGVATQQRRMESFDATVKEMESIGITKGKDGKLSFDAAQFEKSATANQKTTDTTVAKVANDIFSDSIAGMNTSSNALLSNAQNTSAKNPYSQSMQGFDQETAKMYNMFAKSGAFNLQNMGVVGSMMNFSI